MVIQPSDIVDEPTIKLYPRDHDIYPSGYTGNSYVYIIEKNIREVHVWMAIRSGNYDGAELEIENLRIPFEFEAGDQINIRLFDVTVGKDTVLFSSILMMVQPMSMEQAEEFIATSVSQGSVGKEVWRGQMKVREQTKQPFKLT